MNETFNSKSDVLSFGIFAPSDALRMRINSKGKSTLPVYLDTEGNEVLVTAVIQDERTAKGYCSEFEKAITAKNKIDITKHVKDIENSAENVAQFYPM